MEEKVALIDKSIIKEYEFKTNEILEFGEIERVLNVINKKYTFMDRSSAENDYKSKQIIPYIAVKNENKYLLIKRTKKQSEARLHDKYSLGVGGHINTEDIADDIINKGFERELAEEIDLTPGFTIRKLGIIDDEREEVGKVHIGIVYLIESVDNKFSLLEPDKMTGNWADISEIEAKFENLEGWSKVLFTNFIQKLK